MGDLCRRGVAARPRRSRSSSLHQALLLDCSVRPTERSPFAHEAPVRLPVDEVQAAAADPHFWDDLNAGFADGDSWASESTLEDWSDDEDGAWEAPMVENPRYKGTWVQKRISNPAYMGAWKHPVIPNPQFVDDSQLCIYDVGAVGIDIWQVESGSRFSNIQLDVVRSDAVKDEL